MAAAGSRSFGRQRDSAHPRPTLDDLGVRRAGVTTALAKLYEDGAVIKTRGTVEIVDRAVLEKKTCQCYRIISSEYKRMTEAGSQRYTIEKIPPASGRLGRAA